MIDPEYYVGAVRGAGGGWTTNKYSDALVDGRISEEDMQVLRCCSDCPALPQWWPAGPSIPEHARLSIYLVCFTAALTTA